MEVTIETANRELKKISAPECAIEQLNRAYKQGLTADGVRSWLLDDFLRCWILRKFWLAIERSTLTQQQIAHQPIWFDPETNSLNTISPKKLSSQKRGDIRPPDLGPFQLAAVDATLGSDLFKRRADLLLTVFDRIRDTRVLNKFTTIVSAARACGDELIAFTPLDAESSTRQLQVEKDAYHQGQALLVQIGAKMISQPPNEDRPDVSTLQEGDEVVFYDHLDGRRLWQHGMDMYCVGIGIARLEQGCFNPVASVIYRPSTREFYAAVTDGEYASACRLDEQRYEAHKISPWDGTVVKDAVFATHLSTARQSDTSSFVSSVLARLPKAVDKIVVFGCGTYSLSMVASGRIGAYVNTSADHLKVLPGKLLVELAGKANSGTAQVTNLLGDEWTQDGPGLLASGNKTLHETYSTIMRMMDL